MANGYNSNNAEFHTRVLKGDGQIFAVRYHFTRACRATRADEENCSQCDRELPSSFKTFRLFDNPTDRTDVQWLQAAGALGLSFAIRFIIERSMPRDPLFLACALYGERMEVPPFGRRIRLCAECESKELLRSRQQNTTDPYVCICVHGVNLRIDLSTVFTVRRY